MKSTWFLMAAVACVAAVAWAGDLTTFTSDDFSGSGVCAQCHSRLVDAAGRDVSIDTHWRSTMMAASARDPLWRAKVAAEVAAHPSLAPVIEAKCARCHTPMAYTQAHVQGQEASLLEGFLRPAHPLGPAALDGVSCTLCHQIRAENLGQPASFTGGFQIDTSTSPPNRRVYGPFPNPTGMPMRNFSGFDPGLGPQVGDSAFCGACHTLYTPYVDDKGQVLGEFPEQTPYLEWLASAYAAGENPKTCQACHMPTASGAVTISNRPPRLNQRAPFGQHIFVGGNAFMLALMGQDVAELGLSATPAQLAATRALTLTQLEQKAARIEVLSARKEGATVRVKLGLANLAGHKLPSGFPSRRAWVHLTLADTDGKTVFESGRPLAGGGVKGLAAGVSPHHQVITSASQVQIYETVLADWKGRPTTTLLSAASYLKDNRLLPRGFDKAAAHRDIAAHGQAASDPDFVGGADQVEYVMEVGQAKPPFMLTARLLYQTVPPEWAGSLAPAADASVARFMALYDRADKTPLTLARVERKVE